MFAKPSIVRERRIKRRVKAAVSILVALAAGTFITCKRGVDAAKEAVSGKPNAEDAGVAADASSDVASNAEPSSTSLAPYDAGSKQDAAFDATEHKKGMPVPDNLLE